MNSERRIAVLMAFMATMPADCPVCASAASTNVENAK
jgi:hypothetical protein